MALAGQPRGGIAIPHLDAARPATGSSLLRNRPIERGQRTAITDDPTIRWSASVHDRKVRFWDDSDPKGAHTREHVVGGDSNEVLSVYRGGWLVGGPQAGRQCVEPPLFDRPSGRDGLP